MAEHERPPQHPLDRERLRLETQDTPAISSGLLGCLVVGLLGLLLLVIVELLALL